MLCVDKPEPAREMTRKRSVVWGFFKTVDSESVQCLLCRGYQSRQVQGSTTAMLRHLRVKHPKEVAKKCKGRAPQTVSRNGHQDVDTDSEQFCSEAAQGGSAEQTPLGEASDDLPVRRSRHKRSLIWRHYEHLDSLNAARCRICMKKLQCFEGGGTSNLRRHMSKRHPEVFSRLVAGGLNPPPPNSSQGSNANGDTSTSPETAGATEQRKFSGVLKGSRASEGEKRVLRRERELIEALRRAQKEEARALEHQRELLEKLRAADAREAAAEREKIESLRKVQQEEAKELSGQREELQKEKAELQKKWEELQQEREELLLFSRGQ
ncbi:zinc finger BED domain-containing protein isoform X2 [Xiphias gladius]|uniref:zinc finger BED domain-containing protein isoform X2 n=1 Tax=Xiphias gladius TaxID=8245 RepID=UPI001A99EE6D|nr:zinc finger BED domain-containing protein isoform X2 [Xiphias gladius]